MIVLLKQLWKKRAKPVAALAIVTVLAFCFGASVGNGVQAQDSTALAPATTQGSVQPQAIPSKLAPGVLLEVSPSADPKDEEIAYLKNALAAAQKNPCFTQRQQLLKHAKSVQAADPKAAAEDVKAAQAEPAPR